MKILYRQANSPSAAMNALGITDCYFKQLSVGLDQNAVTKAHHHTCFETHIVTKGSQRYEAGSREYLLLPGTVLMIPPRIRHRVIASTPDTEKTSITFRFSQWSPENTVFCPLPADGEQALAYIKQEAALNRSLSRVLVENRVFESIVTLLRLAGLPEDSAPPATGEHSALSLSRQYIADNIENAPTVGEVAQYCNLSQKQLTRLFLESEGISPGGYILRGRTKHIEKLLIETQLSLSQISERMHFSSEYYFSSFFKKQAGMPPGEYRRMHGK